MQKDESERRLMKGKFSDDVWADTEPYLIKKGIEYDVHFDPYSTTTEVDALLTKEEKEYINFRIDRRNQ